MYLAHLLGDNRAGLALAGRGGLLAGAPDFGVGGDELAVLLLVHAELFHGALAPLSLKRVVVLLPLGVVLDGLFGARVDEVHAADNLIHPRASLGSRRGLYGRPVGLLASGLGGLSGLSVCRRPIPGAVLSSFCLAFLGGRGFRAALVGGVGVAGIAGRAGVCLIGGIPLCALAGLNAAVCVCAVCRGLLAVLGLHAVELVVVNAAHFAVLLTWFSGRRRF